MVLAYNCSFCVPSNQMQSINYHLLIMSMELWLQKMWVCTNLTLWLRKLCRKWSDSLHLHSLSAEKTKPKHLEKPQLLRSLHIEPSILHFYFWPPYGLGQAIIFLPCGFFFFCLLLLSTFFSSPNPSRCRLDTWCGLSANLGCMSEMCCTWLAKNAGRKQSPSGHHHTTLSGYIFATKAHIDNRKKNC